MEEMIKRKKIKKILNDWNKIQVLKESNQTYFRNRSEEHGIFFGKVVYQKDFLKKKLISEDKFVDDQRSFTKFTKYDEE